MTGTRRGITNAASSDNRSESWGENPNCRLLFSRARKSKPRFAGLRQVGDERNTSFLGNLQMGTGNVKWFNDSEGFGLITPDAGGDSLFVHIFQIPLGGIKNMPQRKKC